AHVRDRLAVVTEHTDAASLDDLAQPGPDHLPHREDAVTVRPPRLDLEPLLEPARVLARDGPVAAATAPRVRDRAALVDGRAQRVVVAHAEDHAVAEVHLHAVVHVARDRERRTLRCVTFLLPVRYHQRPVRAWRDGGLL